MLGKKRIKCKIVNYTDGVILQAIGGGLRKKYIIGNIKDCNKSSTVLEFTPHNAQRIVNNLNKLYGSDVWLVSNIGNDPFEI